MTDPSGIDSAQPPAGEDPQSDPQSANPASFQPDDLVALFDDPQLGSTFIGTDDHPGRILDL